MTSKQTVHYRDLSAVHLRLAQELLAEGDPMEALERGWAAVATELKLAANARSLPHHSHRDMWAIVRTLVEESGDTEISNHFGCVRTMYINFYDVPYEPDDIEWYLDNVERLRTRLDALA